MVFDPTTMIALTAMLTSTVGILLVFAWAQNRSHRALLLWGGADLTAAAGIVLLMMRNNTPDFVSITLAWGILATAYSICWAASRSFSNRRALPIWIVAGPVVWFVACSFPSFQQSTQLRLVMVSVIGAAYTWATACELWRGRDERLLSRYPAVVCYALHGGLLAMRALVALIWVMPSSSQILVTPWVAIATIEPLIIVVVCGFLQISMAKERSELVQRRAAATDELTGVASRRAFLDESEQRLKAACKQGLPCALLLFDLDYFKRINDSHGHQVGDQVLQLFAARVSVDLPAGSRLGRIGGEEFAVLLTRISPETALRIAGLVRRSVRAMRFDGDDMPRGISVSVGVATGVAAAGALGDLLTQADQALYAAKAAGRNCVQHFQEREIPLLRAM